MMLLFAWKGPVAALSYLANECGDDLGKYCKGVKQGEGRLLNALKE